MTEQVMKFDFIKRKKLDLAEVTILKEKLNAVEGLSLQVIAGERAKAELRMISRELEENYGIIFDSENVREVGYEKFSRESF